MIQKTFEKSKEFFPNVSIKYKNESLFMKILGFILFFNRSFMEKYVTTIGNTIYFPNKEYIDSHPENSIITYLHELIHIYDSSNINKFLFSILYLMPQLLFILFLILSFIFTWKLLLVGLLFLLPLPAFFRMYYEKRAYTISMYVSYKLHLKYGIEPNLHKEADFISDQFKGSSYMFMWPFNNIKTYFHNVADQIKNNEKPFVEKEVYDIIDKILEE